MPTREQNSVYLKTCMANALLSLMQHTPPQKITAQQIADRAGVGRATWFRAFESKQEAIIFSIVNAWHSWCEQRGVSYPVKADSTEVLEFFRFHYHMRDTYALLYRYEMQSVLLSAFYQIVREVSLLHENDPSADYSAAFYSCGMIGLLNTWIAHNYSETPEQLLQLVRSVLAKGELQ